MSQKHILNSNAKHTHYSKLLVEVLPHMVRGCLSRLLEVGVSVKRLQVADQDIVAHFIVNLQPRFGYNCYTIHE